jgi:hypothetical protein
VSRSRRRDRLVFLDGGDGQTADRQQHEQTEHMRLRTPA